MSRVRQSTRAHLGGERAPMKRRTDSATAAARDLGPCVYAVRVADGVIKIGFTTNLDRRIRRLGAVWADVLLALPGSFDDEQALHQRFAEHRAYAWEYYRPADEILRWINDERARLGASAVA